jgi:uncharacterized protein YukE
MATTKTVKLGTPAFKADLSQMDTAITTVASELDSIRSDQAALTALFSRIEGDWQTTAGASFVALQASFSASIEDLVSLLDQSLARLKQSYTTYYDAEALNAQILTSNTAITAEIAQEKSTVNADNATITAENSRITAEIGQEKSTVSAGNAKINAANARITAEINSEKNMTPAQVKAENVKINAQIAAEKPQIASENAYIKSENATINAQIKTEKSQIASEKAYIKTENATINAQIATEKSEINELKKED